jgi:octaprenyl-diphosphate synthase
LAGNLAAELEADLLAFETALSQELASDVQLLRRIVVDLVGSGGKRLRPRLSFLAARAVDLERGATEVALVSELIHSATLLHDDLVDHAHTRRGKPAAFQRYGTGASVLTGDYLLARAVGVLARIGEIRLVPMVAAAARSLAEMEIFQVELTTRAKVAPADYYRIIAGKTGGLFAFAAEAPAVLARAPLSQRQALHDFGLEYGLAFQMRDDYLDLMGDPELLGKPVGGDLREGQPTLVTIELAQRAPQAAGPILARRGSEPGDLERLQKLVQETGADQAVLAAIAQRTEQALNALRVLPESPARRALAELAQQELERSL